MTLQTKYFGGIEYEQKECISFPAGLFGFEEERSFLLIPFQDDQSGLLCLQSTQTPELAFIAVDPFSLKPNYAPVLSATDLEALGAAESQDLSYYTLCVVRNPVANSTVNLKCPVAVNVETRTARQVILDTEEYEMRHPLAEFGHKEEDALC